MAQSEILNPFRTYLQDPAIRVGDMDHRSECAGVCVQQESKPEFYGSWEVAEQIASHINADIFPGIVSTRRTINSPDWMARVGPEIAEDTIKFCRTVGSAIRRGVVASSEIEVRSLYEQFAGEALVTTAMLGPVTIRPQLYYSPVEIALWRQVYPDIKWGLFKMVVSSCCIRKRLLPDILDKVAEDPPDSRLGYRLPIIEAADE